MTVSRTYRRKDLEPRVRAVFADQQVSSALDPPVQLDLARHDCYGDIKPTEAIIDGVLVLSEGSMGKPQGSPSPTGET